MYVANFLLNKIPCRVISNNPGYYCYYFYFIIIFIIFLLLFLMSMSFMPVGANDVHIVTSPYHSLLCAVLDQMQFFIRLLPDVICPPLWGLVYLLLPFTIPMTAVFIIRLSGIREIWHSNNPSFLFIILRSSRRFGGMRLSTSSFVIRWNHLTFGIHL